MLTEQMRKKKYKNPSAEVAQGEKKPLTHTHTHTKE